MLKLDKPFNNKDMFIIYLFFSTVQIWILRVNKFFWFLVDILPRGSAYFADPDPGGQNVADPKDPDPKHWK